MILTTTLMINKSLNLFDLLHLLYRSHFNDFHSLFYNYSDDEMNENDEKKCDAII